MRSSLFVNCGNVPEFSLSELCDVIFGQPKNTWRKVLSRVSLGISSGSVPVPLVLVRYVSNAGTRPLWVTWKMNIARLFLVIWGTFWHLRVSFKWPIFSQTGKIGTGKNINIYIFSSRKTTLQFVSRFTRSSDVLNWVC